jgi:hypothetical protein
MISISEETEKRIRAMFPPNEIDTVRDMLLNECSDNLPLVEAAYAQLAERIRFSVLKLSQGDIAALRKYVEQAKIDWRDVLVAAGFGSGLEDHLQWWPGR